MAGICVWVSVTFTNHLKVFHERGYLFSCTKQDGLGRGPYFILHKSDFFLCILSENKYWNCLVYFIYISYTKGQYFV